jgi:translation initiation factor 3 subunit J
VAAVAPPPKPKKSVKQAIAEREERERKAAAEKALRKVADHLFIINIKEQGLDLSDIDEDPRDRRERERAAELAADLETAQELFSTTKLNSTNGTGDEITSFHPKTKEDFDEFSKRLTAVITSLSNMPHYAMFVAGLVKAISEPLGSDDVKKVTSGLTALGNEKLKAEKGSGGKAKKGKKPTLVVGAAKSAAPKFDTKDYGDDDDFDDFMVHQLPFKSDYSNSCSYPRHLFGTCRRYETGFQ